MRIEDFADVINKTLVIRRFPNQRNRYSAQFEDSEVKENRSSRFIGNEFGDGKSPGQAVDNYIKCIKGKILVFHTFDRGNRHEFIVPEDLTS